MDEQEHNNSEIEAENAALILKVAELEEIILELKLRLDQNSDNSSLPPSSDKFRNKPRKRPNRIRSGRKQGAQPGHKGSSRSLLSKDKIDAIENFYPEVCENCWKTLPEKSTGEFTRHQVVDLDPVAPITTEYRAHEVACPNCGYKSKTTLSEEYTCSSFGPRLSSVVATLTGRYHISRRSALSLIKDFFGIHISLGSISNIEARLSDALENPAQQIHDAALEADVKHTDGTSWYQCGHLIQLWVIATTQVTFYKILLDGSSTSLQTILSKRNGILISDRAAAINFWVMKQRQICCTLKGTCPSLRGIKSHLLRKFISFSERDGPAGQIGKDLLDYTGLIFNYWREFLVKNSRTQLKQKMKTVCKEVEVLLQKGVDTKIKGVSGSCKNILKHEEALWTYLTVQGVDPTNNHAERELRGFVLWRRRCFGSFRSCSRCIHSPEFGSQSERGNDFAERVMTISHTARKQALKLLGYFEKVFSASRKQISIPLLLTA
jgi:transposase